MRFLIDENLPTDLVKVFEKYKHHARHILFRSRPGRPDHAVFEIAQKEGRILVTCDLDFSDIRHYPPGEHAGIIILRLEPQSVPHFIEILETFLKSEDAPHCSKAIVILENSSYRIRTKNIF